MKRHCRTIGMARLPHRVAQLNNLKIPAIVLDVEIRGYKHSAVVPQRTQG